MNKAGHASFGALVGVIAARQLNDVPTVTAVLNGAMSTAAASLVPDLDHPKSTATTHLGVVTEKLSWMVRETSGLVYRLTKGPRDEDVSGKHRGITHTVVFAALLGFGTTQGCQAAAEYDPRVGAAVMVGLIVLLASLAATFFGKWAITAPGALGVSLFFAGDPVAELNALAPQMGWYIALGCVAHCLTDAITKEGCAFMWPIPWKGETFYEIRPPAECLRIRAGGPAEAVLVPIFITVGFVIAVHMLSPEPVQQLLTMLMDQLATLAR
ncbi:metal-dependent hydrolase [Saccharopolyspora griseoalba]|uniref:Metal-dependent hydrolase n=1 Tax=Saccharopolyspora griseoalba TaxID=1431848 RepID=A0ABW2LUQ9_9PSEU